MPKKNSFREDLLAFLSYVSVLFMFAVFVGCVTILWALLMEVQP